MKKTEARLQGLCGHCIREILTI